MNTSRILITLIFYTTLNTAFGSFREHKEFKVTNVVKESETLIDQIDKGSWMSLNVKDSAFSITISKSEEGELFHLDFITRAEVAKELNETTTTHQTINFITVAKTTEAFRINQKGIALLEKKLRSISGFTTLNEANYNSDKIHVSSIQKVSCDVVSKEEILMLIDAYFSHIDRKAIIWEDGN